MRWYRIHSRRGIPVSFHLEPNEWHVKWSHIYGVRIGAWFIGFVRSQDTE